MRLCRRKHPEFAAGWDIRALEETVVSFRSSVMVPTGIGIAIPEGYEGQIRKTRSSLGKKGNLILPHSIGTIDSDYRGDLYVQSDVDRRRGTPM